MYKTEFSYHKELLTKIESCWNKATNIYWRRYGSLVKIGPLVQKMKIFTYIVNVFLLFCSYGVWLFILKKSNRLHWGKILTNFDEIGSLNLDKLSMCTCVHSFALKLIWSTIWTNLSCFPSMVLSAKLGSNFWEDYEMYAKETTPRKHH